MDSKTCLKYIISVALCLGYSRIVKSMECKIGGMIQKPEISVECSPFLDTFKLPKENCQILSCKTNQSIEWKMIDPKKGKLEIQFYGVNTHCNYEAYQVELEIYNESGTYEESLMCDTSNLHWKTHSKRILLNTQCPYCPSEECMQIYKAYFKYVFPGIYRLKLTPYIGGSTRQAQRSYRIQINSTITHYVKKQFTDLHLNASFQYRSIPEELDLGIPLLIDDLPEEMKIEVKFSYDYIDIYEITKFIENENSTSISCVNGEKKTWPSCKVHNKDLMCKFYNMSQGFYSVYISFKDDRCMEGTIWVRGQTDPCYWVIKKEFTFDETSADAVNPYNESTSSHILYNSVVVVIIVLVIIISFIVKKLNKKKRRLRNGIVGEPTDNYQKTNNTEQVYNFNSGFTNKFNFGQLLTLNEKPRPEVLLVYTRETPAFMELITCLRRVLDKIFKCQVYDYFNPDLWNDVSEDPKGWVHSLIVERQAKVMIIASEVAAIRHRSLMGEFPTRTYKTPHPFDHLFLYALRLIRDNMDEESYKNHFVITFDGFTESSHILEYFNPYTRFVLPKHLPKLFEHLHDSNVTLHFDTNKLEERYEVRQLRLQLEHLINLKLLANSDTDKHKLYDW